MSITSATIRIVTDSKYVEIELTPAQISSLLLHARDGASEVIRDYERIAPRLKDGSEQQRVYRAAHERAKDTLYQILRVHEAGGGS